MIEELRYLLLIDAEVASAIAARADLPVDRLRAIADGDKPSANELQRLAVWYGY